MKHTKIIILLVAFLGLSVVASAQLSQGKNGLVDEKAKEVIIKAQNKIKSTEGISFVSYVVVKDQEKKERERHEAKVLLAGNKYRIYVKNHAFYCDGVSVWHHNKETKEVVVNNIEKEEDNILNPAKLLANYEKNFKSKFIRTEEDGTFVIDFTPKKNKEYHKIRILIDKNYQIKQLEMFYYDSSKTEYIIEQYKTGVKSAETDFVFDKAANKDVEVIDMR